MATPKKKSKFIKSLVIALLFFAAIIVVAWFYLQYSLQQKSKQTFYKAFGISIPNNYTINGIDVSKYQSYIYWSSVKKMMIDEINIDFTFIKATEGNNTVDAMFKRNWQLSKENNITHGAYHFFIATRSGKLQAQNFINTVSLQKGDLPPVIDVEEIYNVDETTMKQRLLQCLQIIEQHYKVKPIIYTYADFYEKYLSKDFANYKLWIAHYTNNNKPDIANRWLFWQHSQEGRVNGITEKVDFNVFNGNQQNFEDLLIK